jgi:hypothetical protein
MILMLPIILTPNTIISELGVSAHRTHVPAGSKNTGIYTRVYTLVTNTGYPFVIHVDDYTVKGITGVKSRVITDGLYTERY